MGLASIRSPRSNKPRSRPSPTTTGSSPVASSRLFVLAPIRDRQRHPWPSGGDNDGVNKSRRNKEAAIFLGGTDIEGQVRQQEKLAETQKRGS